jgi:hypothetical protein
MWRFVGQTTAEGAIIPYDGIDTSDPIDSWSENTGFGNVATTTAITTDADNDKVVALFGIDVGKSSEANNYFSTSTTPYGMTKKYDLSNTPFGPSIGAMEVTQVTAGNPGNSASTTISGNKARYWASHQIALHETAATVAVVTTGSYDNDYNSSGSFSINSNGGTACFLGFGGYRGATVSSLTWGGNSMTQAARNDTNPGGGYHSDIWYIKNPPSGSQTLAYSYAGGTQDQATFGWLCTTCEASSPIGAVSAGPGVSPTSTATHLNFSLTTTAANSLILSTLFSNGNSGTISASGTPAWSVQNLASSWAASSGQYQSATTIDTYTPGFSWTTSWAPDAGTAIEILVQ